MAYEPIRKYGDKDKLPSGDPGKVIYGAELDEEFAAISTEMGNIETTIEEKWDEVTGDIPGIGKGREDGETLSWNKGSQAWEPTDLLKVQPVDGEVVIDNMLVTQAVDGPTQTPVAGHHGMVYKAEKYDNANDPWSGINGLDWQVGFIRPRDDGKNTNRKNGYDIVSDRFTVRLTRDYSTTDWWETQIVFRADGDQLELGSRKNPQTVKINGALTCTNSTELGNDNADQHVFHGDVYVGYLDASNVPDTAKGDTTPGTMFVSRGIKLVVDPASVDGQAPSFNCGGHNIVQLANANSDDQAPNWGQVRNLRSELSEAILSVAESSDDFEAFKNRLIGVLQSIDAEVSV